MNKNFYTAILIAILLSNSIFAFSQTKVVIYNGNSNQIENKAFAVNLITSFTNDEFKFEASDKTPNINYLLRNQGQNVESGNVSDEVVVLVCDKLEVDYVVNFILYPNKTQDNVYASLINAKTFSVDKTVTLTCSNLKNSSDVKVTTDKIASVFLLGNLIAEKEAQNLAKQKEKEEKVRSEQKAKEEKLLAEQKAKADKAAADSIARIAKEEKLLAEQKAKEEKLLAEQSAKEEKLLAKLKTTPQQEAPISKNFNPNISFREFKTQLKVEKKTMLAGNSLALASYKKYRAEKSVGWTFFALGAATAIAGGVIWPMSNYYYQDYGFWGDGYDDYWGELPGIIMVSVGGAMFVTGVGLLIASAKDLKTSYNFYTKGGKTACTLNVTPLLSPKFQGIGLMLRF